MSKLAGLVVAVVLCCLPVADLHGDGDGILASAASLVILQKAGPVVRVHIRPVAVGGVSACRLRSLVQSNYAGVLGRAMQGLRLTCPCRDGCAVLRI